MAIVVALKCVFQILADVPLFECVPHLVQENPAHINPSLIPQAKTANVEVASQYNDGTDSHSTVDDDDFDDDVSTEDEMFPMFPEEC